MRSDLTATLQSAFEDGSSYFMTARISVEPTLLYFPWFDNENDPGFSDVAGLPDEPVLQCFGVTSGSVPVAYTFYNDGGTLKYQISTSATLVATSETIKGQPGCMGSRLCWVDTSNNLKYATLDPALLGSLNAAPWSGSVTDSTLNYTATYLACHFPVSTMIVVVYYDNGGLRTSVADIDGTPAAHTQQGRFMFPVMVQTSGSSRSESSHVSYTAALYDETQDAIYVYASNHITGGVDGVMFTVPSLQFSDIFKAVPADLKASISEFRVSNTFTNAPVHFMCGTFLRHENIDDAIPYTMILRSTDGRNWTLDRFSLVSDMGYRNFAAYEALGNQYVWLGSCNRTARLPATWLYDATAIAGGDAHMRLAIDKTDINRYTDDMVSQLEIELAGGSEDILFDAYIVPTSRLTLDLIYKTSAGEEAARYGTYFIDRVAKSVGDGRRSFQVSAVNASRWQLAGMTAPFYTEIISKSSGIDTLTSVDQTILYTAERSGLWEEGFSVDFWEGEGWEDDALGITALNIHTKGGIDRTHASGNHSAGVRTGDLKSAINCYEYPVFTSGSGVFEVFGWSYAESGATQDEVRLHLWCETDEGVLFEHTETGGSWPVTYPGDAAGDYPIVYTVVLPEGTRVREVGLNFVASAGTYIYPCRVDATSGVSTYYGASDANSGWYSALDKEWKVRGKCRPYIMFSRTPYDTENFIIAAGFTDTVTGYSTFLSPVGYGLVGLAKDGRDYIVGRYDKVSGWLRIVKVRDGVETNLAGGAPTTSQTGGGALLFSHRDGKFDLRTYNSTTKEWVEEVSYEWEEADGWMFTDQTAAKHTGIYGIVNVPSFRITGFDEGGDPDEVDTAVGLAMLPGFNTLSEFPSSGQVEIAGRYYTYTNKISNFGSIRGPFQYRQHDHYTPPYGDGWGLQIRDHDWGSGASYAGWLMGVDDGFVYSVTGQKWNNFNSTHGVRQNLPGRTTYYANGDQVQKAFHTLANRVYITNGLGGVDLFEGEGGAQPWGATCYLRTRGDIKLLWFWGSSGDTDVTIADLIERLSVSAGAEAQFPGDVSSASFALLQSTLRLVDNIQYSEGVDISFNAGTPGLNNYVDVVIQATAQEHPTDTRTRVRVKHSGTDTIEVSLYSSTSETLLQKFSLFNVSTSDIRVRVLFHKQFITVYVHNIWAFTFHTTGMAYADTMPVYLFTAKVGGHTVTDLILRELGDWREAIYIDLETDGSGAIGSVIQERPIEIYARWDGSLAYWYDPVKTLVATLPYEVVAREHSWTEQVPSGAASDAIIYYSEVKTIQNTGYSGVYGFSTKVYRFPSLEAGAVKAAKITLQRELSKKKIHNITVRPNMLIEVGDKVCFTYVLQSGHTEDVSIYVDSTRLNHEPENSQMVLEGREV